MNFPNSAKHEQNTKVKLKELKNTTKTLWRRQLAAYGGSEQKKRQADANGLRRRRVLESDVEHGFRYRVERTTERRGC